MTWAKLLCVGLGGNWRRPWAADAISSLGDGAYAAAILLLAVYFTRSPAQVAGVATVASLPWLCSLHAGALADRYDRRRLMATAQIVQALAVSIAAVTAMVPGGRIWMLYVTSFALGAAETVFANSAQSMLPAVVGPAQLEAANVRQYATETVAQQFIGPPLGSLLFAAALPATRSLPFWLDALTFALSAFLIGRIYLPQPAGAAALAGPGPASAADTATAVRGPTPARRPMRHDIAEGLRWLAGHRLLRTLAAIGAASAGVVGALARDVYVMVACMAESAFSATVRNVATVSMRQRIIPDRIRGRVNSVYRLAGWGSMPIGAAIGGAIATTFGLRSPWFLAADLRIGVVTVAALALRPALFAAAEAGAQTPRDSVPVAT